SGRARAACRPWPRAPSRSAGVTFHRLASDGGAPAPRRPTARTTSAEFLARIRGEMAKTRGLFPASPAERPAQPRQRLDLLRRELSERRPQTRARLRSAIARVAGA